MILKKKTFVEDDERIAVTPEFIKGNKLALCRSQDEIANRMRDKASIFGPEVLIDYLLLESANPFLELGAYERYATGKEQWNQIVSCEECVQDFLDYMVFAWHKSFDQRGLSASRSVEKLSCWLWLLGRDDLVKIINNEALYNPYGAPALIEVCVSLGISVPKWLIDFSKEKIEE